MTRVQSLDWNRSITLRNAMERENQDLRQQMSGLRREIQHQKNRVEAYARAAEQIRALKPRKQP